MHRQTNSDGSLIMYKLNIYSFVDLMRIRKREALERSIDRLLRGDGSPFPPHYSLIRSGTSKFCFTGFNSDVLDDMREHVLTSVTTSEFTKMDKPNCILAIELMRTMPAPAFSGVSFEKGEKIDLPIGGIVLHVVTDATLSWVDSNGIRHYGAIKAKIKKGNYPRESAEMASCLIAKALKEKHPDAIIDPMSCLCFDVFRQRLVPASNLSRNFEEALQIAAIISSKDDLAA